MRRVVAIVDGVATSPLLAAVPGLVHGFTTRALGSMAGSVFPPEEQGRNRDALEERIGMPVVKASQVHGNAVALVERGRATRLSDGAAVPLERAGELEADALLTRERGLALAVAVADCVPVLVRAGEWLGIAHAGWEGTLKRVVFELCRALADRSDFRGDVRAAIGPSIGPCCYDIDAARAERLREALRRLADAALLREDERRHRLDLWLATRSELRRWGIDAVDEMGVCTRDEVGSFFSHRGEHGRAGRGLAFIGWRK